MERGFLAATDLQKGDLKLGVYGQTANGRKCLLLPAQMHPALNRQKRTCQRDTAAESATIL